MAVCGSVVLGVVGAVGKWPAGATVENSGVGGPLTRSGRRAPSPLRR